MNLSRLVNTDFSLLAERGAQEARKWLERSHLARWGSPERATDALEIARAARAISALSGAEVVRDAARPSRFFPGALGGGGRMVAALFPEERMLATRAGHALRGGRFDLLGYRGLSFGMPIDWHLDPVSGKRAPSTHWSEIRALDRGQVGDSKVAWELNRCQWWVTLAREHQLGGAAASGEIASLLAAWSANNPPATGLNWASSLEVSLRLISWCWTAFLLRRPGALDPAVLEALLAGIRDHARHIALYLSSHYSPNTHLTGEALGLFYAGVALPELAEAGKWRELGARILVEQLRAQVHPDGVYFEQAASYQRYTVDIYLHFVILAAQAGFALPLHVSEGLQRMLDFLLSVRRPDGSLPPFGDADGGWLLPLTERRPDDLRGSFSTAAAWFGRADYAWAAAGLAPETVWLLGEEGHDSFHSLLARPPREGSRLFERGGWAVMRSGWGPRTHHLLFDVGPLGCPVSSGHGHADLLGIQCSVFGEPVIVDPGTFGYVDPEWRDRLRVTSAHSTLTVDGLEQAEPTSPFSWKTRPKALLHHWHSGPQLDFADASHAAYQRLPDPVRHRRRVLFIEKSFFVVVDDLEGAKAHSVELRFQLAKLQLRRLPGDGEWLRAITPGRHALLVRTFSLAPLSLSVHEGETAPALGWISPDYGVREPAPLLVYRTKGPLPLRVATLLYPVERADTPPPQVTVIPSASGPVGLEFEEGGVVHFGSACAQLAIAAAALRCA